MESKIKFLRENLLVWYNENKRNLPWRKDKDPYRIWLSEIILQQTRVNQGLPYYQRFAEKYPKIQDLAKASEQEVLKLWQGLGYYSRARNLHYTAKEIVLKFGGKFPENFPEIISLKGIGNYTASAILSIAYNKPYAVLDGNVYRVLSRLWAVETPVNAAGAEKIYAKLADELLDKQNPGTFNEAMMEFGATVCVPVAPLCMLCPVRGYCDAFAMNKVNELPVKLKIKPQKQRFLNYLFINNEEGFWLKERGGGDIWQGLYDMPLIEKPDEKGLEPDDFHYFGLKNENNAPYSRQKHQLTHQTLYINFYYIYTKSNNIINKQGAIFVPFPELHQYPLPKPVEIFVKEFLKNPKLW